MLWLTNGIGTTWMRARAARALVFSKGCTFRMNYVAASISGSKKWLRARNECAERGR